MDSVAFKPGSIVVFAIIVIIIPSHSSNAYKTFIASNKKPVLSRLGIWGVFTGILYWYFKGSF